MIDYLTIKMKSKILYIKLKNVDINSKKYDELKKKKRKK